MHTPTEWVLFNVFIGILIAIDLGIFSRKAHVIHVREAMIRSAVWVAAALAFAGFMYLRRGPQEALLYITGYVVEEALSVDNLFVMLIIFSYFHVPRHHQHKVLLWGIFGALVLRLIFIVGGYELLRLFHWTMYVFGAILVYTALKLLVSEEQYDPQKNLFLRVSRRFLPLTDRYEGDRFFTRVDGRLMMTPLFVVLWVVNTTDVVFAVDSVPAVFSVVAVGKNPPDPFIVYSSNAFAIVGLRSLYFALAGMLDAFHFLRYGLSAILAFVGLKMLAVDLADVPTLVTLGVVGACLAVSVVASMIFKKPRELAAPAESVGTPDETVESKP